MQKRKRNQSVDDLTAEIKNQYLRSGLILIKEKGKGNRPVDDVAVEIKRPPQRSGLKFLRRFSTEEISPFDSVKWEIRTASLTNEKGESVFEQQGVEFPEFWSQLATNVVANKYFRGNLGSPEREHSVRQLIGRVATAISDWGLKDGYFATSEDYQIFKDELTHLLLYQKASFNSPVWFNVGIEDHPQCSACFINSVEDSMSSILELVKTEGTLFKYGSGAGCNLSSIRSHRERLTNGGVPSGPVSFMKGYDAFAGVIKSGGKTRRAAKMVVLNVDHPDIVEFINCKVKEEKKAWSLIDAGYDGSFSGDAYSSVFYQNSNNSVRVTDEFMKAVLEDKSWQTRAVTTGEVVESCRAKDLLKMIAEATHLCGDPGLQFDTVINNWNTCSATERINASNPCSEFMFLDNTACNLASLNLLSFLDKDSNKFDIDGFKHAVRILLIAQDIIIDNASYPTETITRNSHLYRPLGLGYANLGALLMQLGLPYDSDGGRNYAAAVTSLMTGQAYVVSAELAGSLGSFENYGNNKKSMLRVIKKHRKCAHNLSGDLVEPDLFNAPQKVWEEALVSGKAHGYRNAQVTVLAPNGTIGFMMDCDTPGIEPEISLIKYKKMVDGGYLKMVNRSVAPALKKLGYGREETNEILQHIDEH
ncbi:vitamin B12-dependent ribonucleotide reductase, partial [Candidatus Pacearchaeota archaeon]|nr:vitamin B12-dependent ribonucleotide reductase [Candidatus Pacearchaeota archaeon]